jgi:hypothetical protein
MGNFTGKLVARARLFKFRQSVKKLIASMSSPVPEFSKARMEEKAKKQVLHEDFNYWLWLDAEGNYDLEILANHSAFYYMVEHRLTTEETQQYRKRGKKFIDALANKYRYKQ